VVHLKENRCEYEFDFKDVYWNPRLSAEHERIVKLLASGEVMYDVFAGVGPFAIPAGKKKAYVLANDLNPASFTWLQRNVKKNKVHGFVTCFNQDGREFIRTTMASDLVTRLNKEDNNSSGSTFHVVMNLPAIAVEFLNELWGLLDETSVEKLGNQRIVMAHVYCFIKALDGFKEKSVELVEKYLQFKLPKENISEVVSVRNVAPNKEMVRVSFKIPHDVLSGTVKELIKE